jgi:hypothetical protein
MARESRPTLGAVRIDARGALVVTHHMTAHDIEPGVLRQIAPQAQPRLDDPQALAALTDDVGKQFVIAEGDTTVSLVLDKTPLAGDDIALRDRGQLRQPDAEVQVRDALLADVVAEIDNQLNVHRARTTRTLRFTDGAAWRTVPSGKDDRARRCTQVGVHLRLSASRLTDVLRRLT